MVNSGPHPFLAEASAGIAPVFASWDPAFPGSNGLCTWSLVLAKCHSGDRLCPSFQPLSCFPCVQEVVIAVVMAGGLLTHQS